LDGALLLDKPSGPTSHDIVAFARRVLKTSRVGHTGTLDPMATGLLVLLVGHGTRMSQFLVTDEKEYLADVRLGLATPTYDAQSRDADFRLTAAATNIGGTRLQPEDLDRVLDAFRGTFMQMPPPFSAKKIEGVPAYKKARKNEPVELKPVEVTVRALEALPGDPSDPMLVRLRVVSSSGFYVRSLAHDLGQRLGCGAHLEGLRRTRAGRFRIEDARTLDAFERTGETCLIPMNTLLADLPAARLTEEGARRAGHGNSLAPHHLAEGIPGGGPGTKVRLLDPAGEVLGIGEGRPDGLLHPLVVLR
jgi:tRNA pseudouridine55 synthase